MQGYTMSPVFIDEQSGINRTANEVAIIHVETPKLPCLQDSLNPHAGKFVYHTENDFELELYTGITEPCLLTSLFKKIKFSSVNDTTDYFTVLC